MKAGVSGKTLITLTTDLSRRWSETREQWQDMKSAEFEREYLAELFGAVPRSATMFDDLEKILERVRRDCE